MPERQTTLSGADAVLNELATEAGMTVRKRASEPRTRLSLEQADKVLSELMHNLPPRNTEREPVEHRDNRHTERPVKPAELLWSDAQDSHFAEIEMVEEVASEHPTERPEQQFLNIDSDNIDSKVPSIPPLVLSSEDFVAPDLSVPEPPQKNRLFKRLFKKKP